MKTWRKVPWLSIEEAKAAIASLSEEVAAERPSRARRKLGRRLAFAGASLAFSEEILSLPDLDLGIAGLRLAKRTGAVTDDLNRSLAWLSKRRLEAMGCADAKILGEKRKTVVVEGACLLAAPNAAVDPMFLTWSNEEILSAMNEGSFFLASFGSDGRYRVVLRWVEASEPVLKVPEYKDLVASSDIGYLRIEDGELRFGAPEALVSAAVLEVPNGLMKVQVFSLSKSRSELVVLVACRTDRAPPPLEQLQELAY